MKFLSLLRQAFTDPKLALMLALGYSSGLPFLLIFSTQSAWLRKVGVSKAEIGLMSYCLLAYSFKFLWAPIIDRYDPPVLARWLGRRRAWMLLAQLGVAAGLAGLAFADPSKSLQWNIAFAAMTAFAGATQDVTVDGWRIDAAPPDRQGLMFGAYNLGYRLAILCASAVALILADAVGWRWTYLAMASLTAVGIAACLLSPRMDPKEPDAPPSFQTSFVAPLTDLTRRYAVVIAPILLLVAIYRLPDFISGVMATPLYIDLGFTNTQIGTITKLYGFFFSVGGAFAGGALALRLGLMPTLLVGGVAASASHLSLAVLAGYPGRSDLLAVAVSIENFAGGFAGAALIAYMSSLVSPNYAATQYALLSSLYALPGKFIGGLSGFMVESMGYPRFFAATAMIGIPVAVLCLLVWRLSALANSRRLAENPV